MSGPRLHRRALLGGLAATVSAPAGAAAKSRLILLGTGGGPTPKPNRSAPAQVIIVDGAAYVIDCGNGVARQLVMAKVPLTSVSRVFITHHHSDHNADYGNLLLLSWAADLAHGVDTYGPPPLARMTRQFLDMNRLDIRTRMADEGRPDLGRLISVHEVSSGGVIVDDGKVKVTAAVVDHPPMSPALAYRFDCPDRSIVISGDTRPSEALKTLARGADVLVHEVMYLPALEQLIQSEPNASTLRAHLLSSHTSTQEVGRLAKEAGVKTLVLSHFVPGGYPFLKDEIWYDAVRPYFDGELIVGRDLLEI